MITKLEWKERMKQEYLSLASVLYDKRAYGST